MPLLLIMLRSSVKAKDLKTLCLFVIINSLSSMFLSSLFNDLFSFKLKTITS